MKTEHSRNGVPQQICDKHTNGHTISSTAHLVKGNGFCNVQTENGMGNGIHKISETTTIDLLATTNSSAILLSSEEEDPSLAWKKDGQIYNQGPHQILPSSAIYTWNVEGATRISKSGNDEMSKRSPMSVPTLLHRAVGRAPERTALAVKRDGEWKKWTYEQYLKDVRTAAKAFIALGLEKYHSVCILGFNSPEWVISNVAAIYAGGLATGIYTTNSPDACAYIAGDSKANILVVEDENQLEKVLQIKDRLPHLKAIIQYIGEPKEPGIYSWTELLALGSKQGDEILEERLKHISINQCCTLIYTSGTTGRPKGVMLSHDNLTWTAHVICKMHRYMDFNETSISFLPLSHIGAQISDIYGPLVGCASIYFGDTNALKGSLIDTMREVKPTTFFAVPRVWEKIYEKMQEVAKQTTGVKKIIATWAKAQGLEYNLKRMNGVTSPKSFSFLIADMFILSKVRDALGLSRCHLNISAAAPMNHDILKYFMSLNIVIKQIYGMSESGGPHTVATESAFQLGSVGKQMIGVATKLDKEDDDGNGEICMAGRHIQMGYLNQPELTRDAMDEEGWLYSGDVGKLDEDGYLYVTGRIKELLVTAGGENVPPIPIEENVKSALPILSQAMVLGDRLKFLSILLTLKTDIDIETQQPLDSLLPETRDWINENGECKVTTVPEVLQEIYEKKNQKLIAAFQAGLNEANKKAISRAQIVQKWHILPVDFSISGGEFTPTFKVKRKAVQEKYQSVIDELYNRH